MERTNDVQRREDDARPFWPWALGIFALALALRLLHLFELRGSPMVEVLVGDARGYSRWAERLAAGDWLGSEVFYQAPLYPYLMGGVYSILGAEPAAIRLAQAVLGALSCVLLAQAGRRMFNRPTGIATGLLLAFYAPALYYDGIVQKASVAFFFLSLLLFFLSLYMRRPRMTAAVMIGLTLGLLILTRENSLVFAPALALTFLASPGLPVVRRLGALALFAVGLSAALLPVAFRNQHVGGGFHLTTSQLGTNLYIGNNERTDGRYQPLRSGRGDPRYERIDAKELAEAGAGRSLRPSEVSQYWIGEAWDYIRSHPADWAALMGRKLLLTWNAAEVNDAEDLYTYADHSTVLRVTDSALHFGVLAPLAFVGFFATWSGRRRLWPLYLLLVSYMATLLIFYVFGRYRYPMVPFLALFAGAGLTGFRDVFFSGNRSRAILIGLGTVLAIGVCNLSLLSKDAMRATTYMSLGTAFAEKGDVERAVALQTKALEYNPDSSAAHFNLANALVSGRRPRASIPHYRQAIELDPDYVGAYINLANVYRSLGRFDEAIETYIQALTVNPGAIEAYNNLGATYAMRGQFDLAIACFEQVLRLRPEDPSARANLERAIEQRRAAQASAP